MANLSTGRILVLLLILASCLLPFTEALAGPTTYSYDELDRLQTVTYSNGTIVTYAYDQIGNMTGRTLSGNVVTISASAASGGSIQPPGTLTLTPGSNQIYTITPNAGFIVSSLTVDGTQLPGAIVYSFPNVTANHYINANFTPVFTITAGSGPNGSISPAGSTAVVAGSNQT